MIRNNMVSAVIPTRGRPHLVMRAVRSALAQKYPALEVIVVIDGPDSETHEALLAIQDERLRLLQLSESAGAASARNAGVEVATGDWIAFLDDDDEWLPEKTARQMERASTSRFLYPIVSSQLHARTSSYQIVWPRKLPYEPLSEYLLARNSWSYGDGLLSTITLLVPKELMRQVPFRPSLRRHQDLDWVLRAAQCSGAGIEFLVEPLAVWHQAEQRNSISTTADWRISLEWVDSVRQSITARAYAGFLATHVAPQAARQRDWKAFPSLLKKMVTLGRPSSRDLILFLGMWSMPRGFRQMIRKVEV